MAIELDYLNLSKVAVAVNATTPVPENGVGAIIWSTTASDVLKWTGTKWDVINPTPTVVVRTVDLVDFGNNSATTTGLTYGYTGGNIRSGTTVTTVSAGTLTLSASATNYVEVSSAGVVSKNTVGFTAGSYPMATVTTDGSGITAPGIVDKRGVISVTAASTGGSSTARSMFYACT